MSINKVLVTGSDGGIGRVVVKDLQDHGYTVTPTDRIQTQPWGTKIVDCEDLGQVMGVMHGHDAVIHLAAIPHPNSHTAEVVFRNNVMTTFNILEAATLLGIKNVVLASSLSALGTAYRYNHFHPLRVPIDEEHPLLSQDTYGLSKMVGEELADGYVRRTPDMSLVSLRFTAVITSERQEAFAARRRAAGDDAGQYFHALWTYVNVQDAAESCRLAMEYATPGHEAFYIAAPNIYPHLPVEELLARYYPGDYPIAEHVRGSVSPFDCSKAERLLGWKARYNWDGSLFE